LPLNGNRPMLARPFAPVFRDPSLSRAPDGGVRMAWTTAWKDRSTMGLATTRALIHWTDIREVQLMGSSPGALNVWAPELFYDSKRRRWVAHWSSSVEGRFPETRPPQPSWNNRVYGAESTDGGRSFGPARVPFNEGFIANDSYLLESPGDARGVYCLIVKRVFSTPTQHGQSARLYLAFANQATGPFHSIGESITGSHEFCEGPTVTHSAGFWYCYFELSKEGRMGCVRSSDLNAGPWEDVSGAIDIPRGNHHGSVLPITVAEFRRLRDYRWPN
jgi:hypothetical protein